MGTRYACGRPGREFVTISEHFFANAESSAFTTFTFSIDAVRHRAFGLFKKVAQVIWDFVAFGQFHLLHVDRLADCLEIKCATMLCHLDECLESSWRLVQLIGK